MKTFPSNMAYVLQRLYMGGKSFLWGRKPHLSSTFAIALLGMQNMLTCIAKLYTHASSNLDRNLQAHVSHIGRKRGFSILFQNEWTLPKTTYAVSNLYIRDIFSILRLSLWLQTSINLTPLMIRKMNKCSYIVLALKKVVWNSTSVYPALERLREH